MVSSRPLRVRRRNEFARRSYFPLRMSGGVFLSVLPFVPERKFQHLFPQSRVTRTRIPSEPGRSIPQTVSAIIPRKFSASIATTRSYSASAMLAVGHFSPQSCYPC